MILSCLIDLSTYNDDSWKSPWQYVSGVKYSVAVSCSTWLSHSSHFVVRWCCYEDMAYVSRLPTEALLWNISWKAINSDTTLLLTMRIKLHFLRNDQTQLPKARLLSISVMVHKWSRLLCQKLRSKVQPSVTGAELTLTLETFWLRGGRRQQTLFTMLLTVQSGMIPTLWRSYPPSRIILTPCSLCMGPIAHIRFVTYASCLQGGCFVNNLRTAIIELIVSCFERRKSHWKIWFRRLW